MNSGKDYEHESFLSLWLSRFVFPCKIGAPVFSIVVKLASVFGRQCSLFKFGLGRGWYLLQPEQAPNYNIVSGVRIHR
ncbi:hypothetical protein H5410_036785 [Solanum commersonii]|uniref:Aminotransferase-like plant mobile domain-containing protein n=1 Tax=Solanum commersonii TaxID=4109 RepID=A0A9J5Y597_SOLCO|nr:hypothetical protein H5410_036785 [Solanum commersonii]